MWDSMFGRPGAGSQEWGILPCSTDSVRFWLCGLVVGASMVFWGSSVEGQVIPPPATPPLIQELEARLLPPGSVAGEGSVGDPRASAQAGFVGEVGQGAGQGGLSAAQGSGAGAAQGSGAGAGLGGPGLSRSGDLGGRAGGMGPDAVGGAVDAAAAPLGPQFGEASNTIGPGFGAALEAAVATPFAMIGDLAPFSFRGSPFRAGGSPVPPPVPPPGPPHPPGSRGGSPVFPTVRAFKLTDNQSPRPQDRVFFDFNYYNNVNNTLNQRDLSPITQMKAYTYLLGLEKTFNDGMGSVGIRMPIDNLTANSINNTVSTPASTAMGNLSVFAKYILAQNTATGSLVSAGFGTVLPTGPGRFAGAPYLFGINSIYFQPFLGYIYNYNRWYLQGFTGFNFSANVNDVSFIYNDIGIGYFLKRSTDPREFISAVAPTFEVHVNNPLNHRDVFNRFDIAGSPDVVDLTYGLNIQFFRQAVLTFALVTPVSSPKPFDTEAAIFLNIFYGRSRSGRIPIMPPPVL